ncbi:MAG: serine/threonine-protein kinase [Pseudonocardia sp.]
MAEQFGPYRLDALLGRGGMGEVHRAYDTVRHRTVALKRLPVERADDPEFQARFRRESALAAQLSEPHIIPIHDFGEIDGQLYIDMRLVEGTDLASVLARDGPMPPRRAIAIIGQVASALDAAHADGLVHRDVKPSNVIVRGSDEDEFAYLIDFGIAWSAARSTNSAPLTAVGATIGTLDYMAPERFAAGTIDGRADVYSLACVLFELLTGRPPFAGSTQLALLHAHLAVEPPRPSTLQADLPSGLDAVVLRGMAKDPAHRHTTAGELVAAARAALRGHTPPPGPRAAPHPAQPPVQPRPRSQPQPQPPSAPPQTPQPHAWVPPQRSAAPRVGAHPGPVPPHPPRAAAAVPPGPARPRELTVALALQAGFVAVGLITLTVLVARETVDHVEPVANVVGGYIGTFIAVSLVLSVFYLPYLGCALVAFRGRNWARIVTTVMSALAVLVLVIVAAAGAAPIGATLLQLVLVGPSIAVHFTSRANSTDLVWALRRFGGAGR